MGVGCWFAGGTFELSRLSVEHRSELFADCREFFHVNPSEVPVAELMMFVRALLSDPRSRVQAVMAGWSHPISREAMYQLDAIDLMLQRWSEKGKYKPVPRPWNVKKKSAKKRSAKEALRILRPHQFEQAPPA